MPILTVDICKISDDGTHAVNYTGACVHCGLAPVSLRNDVELQDAIDEAKRSQAADDMAQEFINDMANAPPHYNQAGIDEAKRSRATGECGAVMGGEHIFRDGVCVACGASSEDMVNAPPHYNQAGIECIDVIAAATSGKTGVEAFNVGNVIKYLWRYELKNGVEDVKKARWYLDRLIGELEK